MENYKECNAQEVLNKVNELITKLEEKNKNSIFRAYVKIDDVCNDLSIFDWWKENLSLSNLKDMRRFLKEAIKLGYTGYVCFKVGVTGCANGMWAHTKESENGYSPDNCGTLYKSFTPAYNYWSYSKDGTTWLPGDKYDSLKTIKQLEDHMKSNN